MGLVERRSGRPRGGKEYLVKLFLASVSPRRRRLLTEYKIAFRVIRPLYREANDGTCHPAASVRRHALGKALSVVRKVRKGTILSADTVVYYKGKIIGKPKDRREAVRILSRLEGRTHTVYTGVALLTVRGGRVRKKTVFTEKTRVRLLPMSHAMIVRYFKKINPLDKAGAYAIQSARMNIVAEIKGSFTNAVGLPMEIIRRLF
jgi:septum formation protein